MFYTAANTKSSWDALDYVYKLSKYSHILTQEIAFITKLKKKKPNKTQKNSKMLSSPYIHTDGYVVLT